MCCDEEAKIHEAAYKATCEPVVAVAIPPTAVSCEVAALVVLKVGLLEAVMVIG